MSGMVQGGWEYVWIAYGVTTGALLVYAIRQELALMKGR